MKSDMNIIYGINTVKNALLNNRVKKLYVLESFSDKNKILLLAHKASVPVVTISKQDLKGIISNTSLNHQGVVAEIKPYQTTSLEYVLEKTKSKKDALVVILDQIKDPHNLGAILRNADAFNVDAVIYKKRGQVGLNDTVAKVSSGAIDYVDCVEVVNINQTIDTLKKNGYWIIGLDGSSKNTLHDIPDDCKLAIIIGSEGEGISHLVKKNSDMLVKIEMLGNVSCLNASVACGIVLYHIRNFR